MAKCQSKSSLVNFLAILARKVSLPVSTPIETLSHPESDWQLIRVFFDGKEMMDKKYVKHHSCNMFDFLSELEDNKYDEQEETDGEDNIE